MRIAVLSMLEPSADNPMALAAATRIAGRRVISHQIDLAEALEADRILLVAERRDADVEAALEKLFERDIPAQVIADAPQLCTSVTAADELLVLADSLLADPELTLPLLGDGQAIVTWPIETALAAGFERIDAARGWAGAMIVPGQLAESLRDLPRDCDVASSLLRIALMAGVPMQRLDEQAFVSRRWQKVVAREDARAVEEERLSGSLRDAVGRTPGTWLAGTVVRRFGPGWMAREGVDRTVWVAVAGLVAVAVAASWFALFWLALAAFGCAWLAGRAASILADTRRRGRIAVRTQSRFAPISSLAFDLGLLVIVGHALRADAPISGPAALSDWFLAIVFAALLRIGERHYEPGVLRAWLADRFLACVLLAAASAGEVLSLLVMGFLAALLLGWMAMTTRHVHDAEN